MASGWIETTPTGFKAVVRTPAGRRRAKRFAKRAQAKQWLSEMEVAVDRGTFIDPRLGRTTFGAWSTRYRESEALTLRPTTIDLNDSIYRTHVLPAFEHLELASISRADIQNWINHLVDSGLAASTISKYYIIMGKAFAAAVEAGVIAQSPCGKWIKRPTEHAAEMNFLTTEQVSALAGAINPRYRALIFLGAYGGLRIGELAGLRRSRIAGDEVFVTEQSTRSKTAGQVFAGPKTSRGRRVVPLPEPVAAILAEHLELYVPDAPDALVFQGARGGVLEPRSWRGKMLSPAAVKAGIGHVAPHDLRHTAISIWIAAGVSPKEIADRAGHTSVALVLDRYGHLFPDAGDDFRKRVGDLFKP